MLFPHELRFDPAAPEAAFAQLPSVAAVYALYGADPRGEPYLNRTPDLRRRLRKLLTPAPQQSKRLALTSLVRRIAWCETGSDFEATLALYQASMDAFGERASKRLHLRPPALLRVSMNNRYPRLYATNTVAISAAADLFGPFPSKAAAERYAEQVLDLFLLRHCYQDLDPDPAFPGCIYSEMKKCLAPCYAGCTDARYAEEAAQVHAFLSTCGRSMLAELAAERDQASAALDFERAAAVHARYLKVEAVASLASDAVRPLAAQRAVIVQPSAEPEQVQLYLLERGMLAGPASFSVLGMRHPNEQSGSSSLFAHPTALLPVPLDPAEALPVSLPESLDDRLDRSLSRLRDASGATLRRQSADHLSLFARWFYRPQQKREGEVLFAQADAAIPEKALLRAISRVYRAAVEKRGLDRTPTVLN
jgi:excinuclease ABC subunit C